MEDDEDGGRQVRKYKLLDTQLKHKLVNKIAKKIVKNAKAQNAV